MYHLKVGASKFSVYSSPVIDSYLFIDSIVLDSVLVSFGDWFLSLLIGTAVLAWS